ncbi:MAG TPA: hypothetical protein ACFCUC_04960 [Desulfobacterales bacterium]
MNSPIEACGYSHDQPPGNWKEKKHVSKLQADSDAFAVVEINRPFYKLPMFNNMAMFANANDLQSFL